MKAYIQRYIPDVTDAQMDAWERSKALETMVIKGKKWYFHAAGPNLFRIDPQCRKIKEEKDGVQHDGYWDADKTDIPEIIRLAPSSPNHLALPKKFHVRYTLTVKADAVPVGDTIRCWLPFPRTDQIRQKGVRLISTSEKKYLRSPENASHSTLYMERKAEKGKPTVFSEEFEYTSYGQWFNLKPEDIKPYDKTTPLYIKYTSPHAKHITESAIVRHLADSLSKGITNPLLQARAFFKYINDNYPWASAREYSTIWNIPEYVIENHHGDCGQVTLLFLSLCRMVGIPVHFESGFMMHPDNTNLHDWGEIYFEGVGWVPVDQSFGIPYFANDDATRWFFLGGIDPWRMIVNSDYGMPLHPEKKFVRSETVDFQRGEVEWKGGNLYFDKWSWNLEILP